MSGLITVKRTEKP